MNEDDKIYSAFINIMFAEFDADEMAYAHVVQAEAIKAEENGHA